MKSSEGKGDAKRLEERKKSDSSLRRDCKELQHAFSTRAVVKFEVKAGDIDFISEWRRRRGEKQRKQIPLSTLADQAVWQGPNPQH